MDIISLYWVYVKLYFKSRREYRISFFMGLFANIYTYFFVFATFWVITNKFISLGGWNFPEISVLYSLNLLTYAISGVLFWYSIFNLENIVINGNFDRFLLRPVGIIPQLACSHFSYTFLGQIAISLFFLFSNIFKVTTTLSLMKYVYLVFVIISGTLIQAGGMIIVGALSFWTLRSTDIGNIFYYGFREFINYPLNIFPGIVKIGLSFIFPWAFINYYPAVILLNKTENTFDIILGFLAPLVGILFFLISLAIFRKGVERYASTGN